jgi:hypothetical protein
LQSSCVASAASKRNARACELVLVAGMHNLPSTSPHPDVALVAFYTLGDLCSSAVSTSRAALALLALLKGIKGDKFDNFIGKVLAKLAKTQQQSKAAS